MYYVYTYYIYNVLLDKYIMYCYIMYLCIMIDSNSPNQDMYILYKICKRFKYYIKYVRCLNM